MRKRRLRDMYTHMLRLTPSWLAIMLLMANITLALANQAKSGPLFDAKSFRLDNGLDVIVVPYQRPGLVIHMLAYRVGAADEPPGQSGIAHLLEHMMFQGTAHLPDGDYKKKIARLGGEQNAYTGQDVTAYFVAIAQEHLGTIMQMEAERMVKLNLNPDHLATERKVVLEERLLRLENSPDGLLLEAMQAALYRNHPYGLPVIGWEHEIKELDIDSLKTFYHRWYQPHNAILVLAGDISPQKGYTLAKEHYGQLDSQPMLPRKRPREPPLKVNQRVSLVSRQATVPSFIRIWPAPPARGSDYENGLALSVATSILGEGATSHLYQALVIDEPIAASIDIGYNKRSRDSSDVTLWAQPLPGVELERLEQAIDHVLSDFLDSGPRAQDLHHAKKRLRVQAVFARDDPSAAAHVLAQSLGADFSLSEIQGWVDNVDAIGADAVLKAARAVLRLPHVTGHLLPDPSQRPPPSAPHADE